MIPRERLIELVTYHQDSGLLRWKITRGMMVAGCEAGYLHRDGARRVTIDGKNYLTHRLIWLYVYGYFPDGMIDHINRNRADNRLCNLRLATRSQNRINAKIDSNNTSGTRGVNFCNTKKLWIAYIGSGKKRTYLGAFADKQDAAEARTRAEVKLFKEFARTA